MFGASTSINRGSDDDEPIAMRRGMDDDIYHGAESESGDEELPFRRTVRRMTLPGEYEEVGSSSISSNSGNGLTGSGGGGMGMTGGGRGMERELLIPKARRSRGREHSLKVKCIWYASGVVFGVVVFAILGWPLVLASRHIWGCSNSSWLEDLFEVIVPSGFLSFVWTLSITGVTVLVYVVLYALVAVRYVPDVLRVRSFIIDIASKLPCMLAYLPFAAMFSVLTMNKASFLLLEERRRQAHEPVPSGTLQIGLKLRLFHNPFRCRHRSQQDQLDVGEQHQRLLGHSDDQAYMDPMDPGASRQLNGNSNGSNINSSSSSSNSSSSGGGSSSIRRRGAAGVDGVRSWKSTEVELYPSGLMLLLAVAALLVPLIVLITMSVKRMVRSDHLDIESLVSPLCILSGCILSVGICATGICLRKSHLPYYFPVSFYPDWATIFGRGLWLAFGVIVWIIVITGGLFPNTGSPYPLPGGLPPVPTNSTKIKVVTWNMGSSNLNAIKRTDLWDHRKKDFIGQLEYFKPDIFALQDAYFLPIRYVSRKATDTAGGSFRWYGKGSSDGVHTGEHTVIFFRKSRFQLLQSKTFWLSPTPLIPSTFCRNKAPTPEVPDNGDTDDASQRAAIAHNSYLNQKVCTWIRLRDIQSGHQLVVATTHYGAGGDAYNVKATHLILSHIRKASHGGKLPVVLLGDFNGNSSQSWFSELTNSTASQQLGFSDAKAVCNGVICLPYFCTQPLDWTSEPKCDESLGYSLFFFPLSPHSIHKHNSFLNACFLIIIILFFTSDGRVDHVFVSNKVNVTSYRVNRGTRKNGRTYSDHFPVVVDISLR